MHALIQAKLPSAAMDLSLEEYIRVICAFLDIPIYTSCVQSLHVLFTLYSEFKSNQHFMNIAGPDGEGPVAGAGGAAGGANVMTFGDKK